jgi:hypothetical protein
MIWLLQRDSWKLRSSFHTLGHFVCLNYLSRIFLRFTSRDDSRFVENIVFYMALEARSVNILCDLQGWEALLRVVDVILGIWRVRESHCYIKENHGVRVHDALQVLILVLVMLDVLLAVLRVMLVYVSNLNNCALLTQLDYVAVVGLGLDLPCHRVESHDQSASLADLLCDDGKFSCTC